MSCLVGGCGKPVKTAEGGPVHERVFCADHDRGFVGSPEYDRMISWSAATSRGMAAVCDFARRAEAEERNSK